MITNELEAMFQPVAKDLGCEIWGVEFQMQGCNGLLRVYVEREGGAGIDDCENLSREIATLLDVEDPISSAYALEVSTPGMDRRLFSLPQFEAYKGETIKVKLRTNYEGRRNFTGLLAGVEGSDVLVQVDKEEFLFPIESIERANVVPQFD